MKTFHAFIEARNGRGETEYRGYAAWRKALKSAWPNVMIDGDKDIANAFADGKGIGEWDGEVGTIHGDAHKRIIRLNNQPPDMGTFMRDIAQNPSDTFRRMVFADWVDERGHASEAEILRSNKPIFSVQQPVVRPYLNSLMNLMMLNWDQLIEVLKTKRYPLNSVFVNHSVSLSKYPIVQDLIATMIQ